MNIIHLFTFIRIETISIVSETASKYFEGDIYIFIESACGCIIE